MRNFSAAHAQSNRTVRLRYTMDATCLRLGVQSWPGCSFRCGDLIFYLEWAVKVLRTAQLRCSFCWEGNWVGVWPNALGPDSRVHDVDDGYDQNWHYSLRSAISCAGRAK